jgi:hypothetical protein
MLQNKSLIVAALVSVASLGYVQTAKAQDAKGFTPDRMASFAKGLGYKADIQKFQNGGENVTIVVEKDGNRFIIVAEYNPAKTNINFLCPLGNAVPEISGAQAMALMKKSYDLCPVHFTYRDSDKRICLEDCLYNPMGLSESNFQGVLDRLCKVMIDTYPLWDASRWPLNGGQVTLPQTVPSTGPTGPTGPTGLQTPAVQPQPAGVQNLVGTIWIGSENLGNYGRLEFRFQANGQVMMIDSDGSSMGTYTVQNNIVMLTFHQGKVSYAGNINGSTMSGKAGNTAGGAWTFSVSR